MKLLVTFILLCLYQNAFSTPTKRGRTIFSSFRDENESKEENSDSSEDKPVEGFQVNTINGNPVPPAFFNAADEQYLNILNNLVRFLPEEDTLDELELQDVSPFIDSIPADTIDRLEVALESSNEARTETSEHSKLLKFVKLIKKKKSEALKKLYKKKRGTISNVWNFFRQQEPSPVVPHDSTIVIKQSPVTYNLPYPLPLPQPIFPQYSPLHVESVPRPFFSSNPQFLPQPFPSFSSGTVIPSTNNFAFPSHFSTLNTSKTFYEKYPLSNPSFAFPTPILPTFSKFENVYTHQQNSKLNTTAPASSGYAFTQPLGLSPNHQPIYSQVSAFPSYNAFAGYDYYNSFANSPTQNKPHFQFQNTGSVSPSSSPLQIVSPSRLPPGTQTLPNNNEHLLHNQWPSMPVTSSPPVSIPVQNENSVHNQWPSMVLTNPSTQHNQWPSMSVTSNSPVSVPVQNENSVHNQWPSIVLTNPSTPIGNQEASHNQWPSMSVTSSPPVSAPVQNENSVHNQWPSMMLTNPSTPIGNQEASHNQWPSMSVTSSPPLSAPVQNENSVHNQWPSMLSTSQPSLSVNQKSSHNQWPSMTSLPSSSTSTQNEQSPHNQWPSSELSSNTKEGENQLQMLIQNLLSNDLQPSGSEKEEKFNEVSILDAGNKTAFQSSTEESLPVIIQSEANSTSEVRKTNAELNPEPLPNST